MGFDDYAGDVYRTPNVLDFTGYLGSFTGGGLDWIGQVMPNATDYPTLGGTVDPTSPTPAGDPIADGTLEPIEPGPSTAATLGWLAAGVVALLVVSRRLK